MYIAFINDYYEEEIHGPFEFIEEDSRTDDTITFFCHPKEGHCEYVTTPYAMSFMTEHYYYDESSI